jgi:hypothetical protein
LVALELGVAKSENHDEDRPEATPDRRMAKPMPLPKCLGFTAEGKAGLIPEKILLLGSDYQVISAKMAANWQDFNLHNCAANHRANPSLIFRPVGWT